jgi:hypothetical protein
MAHRFSTPPKARKYAVVVRPQGIMGPSEVHKFDSKAEADAFCRERRAKRRA